MILIYIFKYLCGRIFKLLGVFYKTLEHFESRGVIISVADTLVGHYLEIYVLFLVHNSVAVKLVSAALFAVSEEYGQVAEIVNMVVDRLDTERAHACYYH